MQPSALRRISRRAQPGRSGVGYLSHTSTSAVSTGAIQLSAGYLEVLQDAVRLSQHEQDVWAEEVLSVAAQAREIRYEARREIISEASRQIEQQREEQQRVLAERDAQRRARAAERQERQRQEELNLRNEREEAERRRREERAAAEEAERRAAAEAEQRRRERFRQCIICMEDIDLSLVTQTPCSHWSCRTCLRDGFEASFTSRSRYQCCQQHVPISLIADLFTDDFTQRYELLVLELTTPNPTYCANAACAAFIPPANYFGPDSARCDNCNTDTCRHCRTMGHVGRGCTTDQATEQVRALAAVVGWKTCPACTTMVERRDGCLHMTCRCGAEFCYRCGGYWQVCRSRCEGQYF
ncbi:hypothetical protein BKA66DRAFT_320879 [Pyrenochaeta sp. MPI-SDFR-AT-0127]|nr:hypothetical protein BKA66DRAFT_320879 [Pyrenochaeta sp. MPI-SDFR-AT-0127]